MTARRVGWGDGRQLQIAAATEERCAAHEWPTDVELPGRVLRAVEGPGGVNLCRDCIKRARDVAAASAAAVELVKGSG